MKHIIIITIMLICVAACKHPQNPPLIDIKLYAGDSLNSAYVRTQSAEVIKCSDTKTDDMVAMTYADFQKMVNTYTSSCALWDRDARDYAKKLKSCGLLTNSNIHKVSSCLNN